MNNLSEVYRINFEGEEKRKDFVCKICMELVPNFTGFLDGTILLKLRCL